jgi:L-lactate dehydrogenase complex protein LldG
MSGRVSWNALPIRECETPGFSRIETIARFRAQMSSRPEILARIREALRELAPVPGHHGEGSVHHAEPPKEFGQWLPQVGSSTEERIEAFAKNSTDLKTEFHVLASRDELPARLAALAADHGWQRVATHSGALTEFAVPAMKLPALNTSNGYDAAELERCDAGISECDALVAQTGGVLITARSAGGRALSVLPPHHVVLATRAQIVPDLPAAYALLEARYSANWPSFISFITGPSRTGDIERILVLGAHGPKRLTVFLA